MASHKGMSRAAQSRFIRGRGIDVQAKSQSLKVKGSHTIFHRIQTSKEKAQSKKVSVQKPYAIKDIRVSQRG